MEAVAAAEEANNSKSGFLVAEHPDDEKVPDVATVTKTTTVTSYALRGMVL